jgi:hypothetical protein
MTDYDPSLFLRFGEFEASANGLAAIIVLGLLILFGGLLLAKMRDLI